MGNQSPQFNRKAGIEVERDVPARSEHGKHAGDVALHRKSPVLGIEMELVPINSCLHISVN